MAGCGLRQTCLLRVVLAFILLVCGSHAVKLKIRFEECISHEFGMYEPFYGSFVAMPDVYGNQANYNLIISAPSGTKVHETHSQADGKFHLVPYESGRYKFCISLNYDPANARYVTQRDVVWDLHMGHADHALDAMKEHDTQGLWHYISQVDSQLQQLRATQNFLYWREKRHRQTVDSTNRRVLWYSVARASALLLVSLAQVMGIRFLFRTK
mmetsp:Transcript_18835/g.32163  ORF Transcript_18835/g.32163 Transcript_18835/m.32163 type:complete len:212 (+) Transcript_18835:38-673(+)